MWEFLYNKKYKNLFTILLVIFKILRYMADNNNSTFRNLVSELSTDERSDMLEKIKPMQLSAEEEEDEELQNASSHLPKEEDLATKLKQQSALKRFFYWIKAAFMNVSVEDVFNMSLVNGLARNIEKSYPGIIDNSKKRLSGVFYEKVAILKSAAEFFAKYIERYEKNTGAFYDLLAHTIMPEIEAEMEAVSDPYQYPLTTEIGRDTKTILFNKLEEVLEELPVMHRRHIYSCVREVEWLRQFVRLPYGRVLSRFSASDGGSKDCLYNQIKTEFGEFAKVICNYTPITDEVLQALYTFVGKKTYSLDIDTTRVEYEAFLKEAKTKIADILTFVETVPMYDLAKVVYQDAVYRLEIYKGGETWFASYKSYRRAIFERRFAEWKRDVRKEELRKSLIEYFDMNNFPLFPFRPWEHVWCAPFFKYELTLGFLNAFFKNEYTLHRPVLRTIGVEGVFSVKENQIEFTDSINLLNSIVEKIDLLATELSAGGEYGLEFSKYEKVPERHPEASEERVEEMMDEVEKSTLDIINDFGKACRSVKNLMSGITGEKASAFYGPLSNLSRIQGHSNREFRSKIIKAKKAFEHAYELVQELEPLDMAIE